MIHDKNSTTFVSQKKDGLKIALHHNLLESEHTTSPPSPELDFPPNLFMAMAIASWVSLEIAPSDMPPVQNLSTIAVAGSTFPTGIGARSLLNSRRSRRTYSYQFKTKKYVSKRSQRIYS